jgi:hypothetical protein
VTRFFLTRLQIECFRGINNDGNPLDLRFMTDRVNSIFAPNSLGKSSIFEALSYALTGSVPWLDGLPSSEKAEEYYSNRFHSTGSSVIVLTLEADDSGVPEVTIRVERTNDGARSVTSPSGHPDPERLLADLNESSVLLDYKQFVRFIGDSPLDRGRSFSALIGLEQFSQVRRALEVLAHRGNVNTDFQIDLLKESLGSTSRAVEAIARKIRDAYEKLLGQPLEGTIDPDKVLDEATRALAGITLIKSLFGSKTLGTVDFDEIRLLIRNAEKGEKRDRLGRLVTQLSELEPLEASTPEDDERRELAEVIRERDESLAVTRGPLTQQLFEHVSRVLDSDEWRDPGTCPVCESRPANPLSVIVAKVLEQYSRAKECEKQLQTRLASGASIQRLRTLVRHPLLTSSQRATRLSDFEEKKTKSLLSRADLDGLFALLDELQLARTAELRGLEKEKAELERELPPSLVALTEQVSVAEQLRKGLAEYVQNFAAREAVERRLTARERWAAFIKDAATTFAKAEVQLSTDRTSKLETEYRGMYAKIVSTDAVLPCLRKSIGSEELHLRLERFFTLQDVSASALLPESYRNALAISIFLSAALRRQGTARFLVLDDITSSFDAGHQFALMELLRTEVASPANPHGLQVILLSHDTLLEKYFDKAAEGATWYNQRLVGNPPAGAILVQAQGIDRVKTEAIRFISAGQIEQAIPLTRQYLEAKLLEVIRKVNIPVPIDFSIRDDRKAVQACIDSVREAVEVERLAGRLILAPSQVNAVHTLNVPAIIGNLGSHYSTASGTSISPTVLQSQFGAVDNFTDSFKYDCSCGTRPVRRFYKTLSRKACSC